MAAKKPVRGRATAKSPPKSSKSAQSRKAASAAKTGAKAKSPRPGPSKAAKRTGAAPSKSTRTAQGRATQSVKKSSATGKSKTPASKKAKVRPAKTAKAVKAPKGAAKAKPAATKKSTPPAKAPAKKAPPPPVVRPATAAVPAKGDAGVQRTGKALVARKGPDGKLYSRLEHIDDATLDGIIAKLDEMRAESLAVVNIKKGDGSPIGEEAEVGDDMDLASQDRDREFNLLMHERHLRRLQQIDEAFERIREGSYGLCEGTEEPINPRRLMIMPLARYSLEYQQEQEKTLGRTPEEFYFEEEAAIENEEE